MVKRRKANRDNPKLRKAAHHYFDIIWLYKLHNGGKNVAYWRKRQYKWLSKKLQIPRSECHMATMSVKLLQKTIKICSEALLLNEKILIFAEELDEGKIKKLRWFKIQ